jgi:hypothetical protein
MITQLSLLEKVKKSADREFSVSLSTAGEEYYDKPKYPKNSSNSD